MDIDKCKTKQIIKIIGSITLIIVMLIWQIGINMVIGYTYDEYNTAYTKLFIATTIISAAIITISSLVGFFVISNILIKSLARKKDENIKLLNQVVLIGCGCILLFGVYKGYSCIPSVHNYAVLNNLGKDQTTVLEIIKEFKKIHLISTSVYTFISALILYLTGLFYLKKLNK